MSNKKNNASIWMVSREYAGFAEAGGVKSSCRLRIVSYGLFTPLRKQY